MAAATGPVAEPAGPSTLARLAPAAAGVLVISFSATLVHLADVPPAVAALYRCGLAVPILYLLHRRFGGAAAGSRRVALAGGALLGIDLVAWHVAIGEVGTGIATILANTQVLFVIAISVAALGVRVGLRTVLATAVVMAGIVLLGVAHDGNATAPSLLGIAAGIVAAATYAGFLLLFNRAIRASGNLVTPLLDSTAAAALVALVATLAAGDSLVVHGAAWAWLAVLASTQQVAGWILIGRGFQRISAVAIAIFLLVQPLGTTLWGVLFLGEQLSPLQVVGAALVLGGVTAARPTR